MKPILFASLIASSAIAGPRKPPPKKPNFGESFDLHARRTTQPRDVDPATVRSLSEHQAGAVIKTRLDDLENCWLRLPAAKRIAGGATLRVTIEATGVVSSARISDADLPAGVGKCITSAAARWTFPASESRAEIEHGITLTTR
jgi:hypothetical protein